jgi:hypothetical protein
MTQWLRVDDGVTNPGPTARDDRDIFRLAPSMDPAVLETIAARLEFRGTDEGYARRSQAYSRACRWPTPGGSWPWAAAPASRCVPSGASPGQRWPSSASTTARP